MSAPEWDVIVAGAGNAGLSAAIAAHQKGMRVLLLEKAPEAERGGNTAFTGGLFRFAFNSLADVRTLLDLSDSEAADIAIDPYPVEAYADDLRISSEGLCDEPLITTLAGASYETMQWLRDQGGVRWVLATGRQAYRVDGKFRFFGNLSVEASGGGHGLSDCQFRRAERLGIEICYGTAATNLLQDAFGAISGLTCRTDDGRKLEYHASAVILASGGFQANAAMRAQFLGAEWDLAKVRGSRYDTGDGIRMALEIGARPYGHWSSCHAVAWDALAPETGDRMMGDLYQRHSYPIGVVVNREGRRFMDEGAHFRNYTYAKYGREILRQPGRVAFQIFDSKTISLLRDEYSSRPITKVRADTIEKLADEMLIDPVTLRTTIDDFNVSITSKTPFNPSVLDGRSANPVGQPPKSNWALPIDEPPYEAYAVTCGITFTFGGVKVDDRMSVQTEGGRNIPGLFAAGEMVGGIFFYNYPGGAGLMAGAVFGRRAGESAAEFAMSRRSGVPNQAVTPGIQ